MNEGREIKANNSDYAFLLKDRFVKSIGISGGKII